MSSASWPVAGEAIVGLVRARPPLPPGIRSLPGPSVVIAERVEESPVGPYLAFAIARPARIGLRPGLCFTTVVIDLAAGLSAGRRRWGLPGERAALSWGTWEDETSLVWEARGIEVRGWARGMAFPFALPGRVVQRRGDGPVVIPLSMRGRARRARVEVVVPPDDELAVLAGPHRGAVMSGLRVDLHAARIPAGRFASLPAPAPAAEPGWSAVRCPSFVVLSDKP